MKLLGTSVDDRRGEPHAIELLDSVVEGGEIVAASEVVRF